MADDRVPPKWFVDRARYKKQPIRRPVYKFPKCPRCSNEMRLSAGGLICYECE